MEITPAIAVALYAAALERDDLDAIASLWRLAEEREDICDALRAWNAEQHDAMEGGTSTPHQRLAEALACLRVYEAVEAGDTRELTEAVYAACDAGHELAVRELLSDLQWEQIGYG